MTADAFAALVHGRPTGAGRWVARCPGHNDRSPSLSIREGLDGRVVLHCFRGCGLIEILAKLKLSISDLFSGPPPTREQLATLRAERSVREGERRKLGMWLAAPCDNERRFHVVATALAAKLASAPEHDGEPIAAAYHHSLEQARWWQAEGERRTSLVEAGVTG